MSSTLCVTNFADGSGPAWMPTSGTFDFMLGKISAKIEFNQPALATEMRRSIDSPNSYFDLTGLDEETFCDVVKAVVEIYREKLDDEAQEGNMWVSLHSLTEFMALFTFDPRCSLTLFPDRGTMRMDKTYQWESAGWIYALVAASLVGAAKHERRPDIALLLLTSLMDQSYHCDFTSLGPDRHTDMSGIVHWLQVQYLRSSSLSTYARQFEKQVRPAALELAAIYLNLYPYDPEMDE